MDGGIVVCLLGVTFLFVISHVMMLHPDYSESVIQNGFLASLSLPTVWPRFFHIVLGSVAATGMVITLYGMLRPFNLHITRYGVGWTLAGTLPQIIVGPWLLLALPDEVRMRLVDGASLSFRSLFRQFNLCSFSVGVTQRVIDGPPSQGNGVGRSGESVSHHCVDGGGSRRSPQSVDAVVQWSRHISRTFVSGGVWV